MMDKSMKDLAVRIRERIEGAFEKDGVSDFFFDAKIPEILEDELSRYRKATEFIILVGNYGEQSWRHVATEGQARDIAEGLVMEDGVRGDQVNVLEVEIVNKFQPKAETRVIMDLVSTE